MTRIEKAPHAHRILGEKIFKDPGFKHQVDEGYSNEVFVTDMDKVAQDRAQLRSEVLAVLRS